MIRGADQISESIVQRACYIQKILHVGLMAFPGMHIGSCSPMRIAAKVHLGPNRSHAAPADSRTIKVAVKATMFEFAICSWVRFRSFLMVTVKSGGKAYQDQKATKNDHQDSRNTRP